jgi:hypothetical protein
VATRRVTTDGRAILRFGTAEGASLPHGARSVRDLRNRKFIVEVDGATLLEGSLPGIGASARAVDDFE